MERSFADKIQQVARATHHVPTDHHLRWDQLEMSLARVIHGSNRIEGVHDHLDNTVGFCRAVFRSRFEGSDVLCPDPPLNYPFATTNSVDGLLDQRYWAQLHMSQALARSGRITIQHAKALVFLLDRILLEREPWSEQLLRATHRILREGIDQLTEPGEYRSLANTGQAESPPDPINCIPPSAIPHHMGELVHELNQGVAADGFDALNHAARFHNQLYNISPFPSANGPLARLVLNALLLRHAGRVCEAGVHEQDKGRYQAVMARARQVFRREHAARVPFRLQSGHFDMARYLVEKVRQVPVPVPKHDLLA